MSLYLHSFFLLLIYVDVCVFEIRVPYTINIQSRSIQKYRKNKELYKFQMLKIESTVSYESKLLLVRLLFSTGDIDFLCGCLLDLFVI
jgi:hypothetical protein